MNTLLEVIHLTLTAISKSVYNFWFLLIVFIVYLLIKKIFYSNIYNIENAKKPTVTLIEATLQGMVVGIAGSLIITGLGLPIVMSNYIILLLPVSLVLAMINIRYICISYSATVLGVLALVFNGQSLWGITLPNIDINIPGLMAMVGILHLMESILIYFVGAEDCMPIVSKIDGQIVQGHILQKYWPIPIALLMVSVGSSVSGGIAMPDWWPLMKTPHMIGGTFYLGLMPFVGVLGYNTVTFAQEPEKRARTTGIMLFLYSTLMISLAIIVKYSFLLSIIGLILMAAVHEGILLIEQYYENHHKPLYTLPEKGIRIMHVMNGGAAEKAGIKKGSIIKKINDLEIIDASHFLDVMGGKLTFLWIEIENFEHEIKTYEIKAYPSGIESLGIKILPENPRILFKYENLKKLGLVDLLRRRYRKK